MTFLFSRLLLPLVVVATTTLLVILVGSSSSSSSCFISKINNVNNNHDSRVVVVKPIRDSDSNSLTNDDDDMTNEVTETSASIDIDVDIDTTSSFPFSPYRIVIDGGSTGSRLHIFEFTKHDQNNTITCSRSGSTKANIPLSTFASPSSRSSSSTSLASDIAAHLLPLFTYAATQIPTQYHKQTKVYYQATAGMRLLSTQTQNEIYNAMYDGLMMYHTTTSTTKNNKNNEFVFHSLTREDIHTLNGDLEAYYGVVATNYLKGIIDVHLHIQDENYDVGDESDSDSDSDDNNMEEEEEHGIMPIGALDMGGASMQIVFLPSSSSSSSYSSTSSYESSTTSTSTTIDTMDTVKSTTSYYEYESQQKTCQNENIPYASDIIQPPSQTLTTITNKNNNNNNNKRKSNQNQFFSTSYLSYGSDQFRERLWDTYIGEHIMMMSMSMSMSTSTTKNNDYQEYYNRHHPNNEHEHEQQQFEKIKKLLLQDQNQDNSSSCCIEKQKMIDKRMIYNPCSFKGYLKLYKGYILIGTGDATQCTKDVNHLIPHHETQHNSDEKKDIEGRPCHDNEHHQQQHHHNHHQVGGVKHPKIQGKFYAMSLFFFVFDCLRVLSNSKQLNKHWPTPSLAELTNEVMTLCSRSWENDIQLLVQNDDLVHQYTRDEVLPDRCFESVYFVTLLRDGFGFDLHARDITFAYAVDGSEVEWSLGMAITSFANDYLEFVSSNEIDKNGVVDDDVDDDDKSSVDDDDTNNDVSKRVDNYDDDDDNREHTATKTTSTNNTEDDTEMTSWKEKLAVDLEDMRLWLRNLESAPLFYEDNSYII